MKIIDGKLISTQLKEEIAKKVKHIVEKGKRPPHLAVIIVGEDGGSQVYVNNKIKACQLVGIKSTHIELPVETTENELLKRVYDLNNNTELDGFIVQLPLPKHINEQKIIEAISPEKDVDGFTPINIGKMVIGLDAYVPATPFGITELLRRYKIETAGKKVVVLGRSNIVGRPISILMSQKSDIGNATVTVCHSKTPDLMKITNQADILIAAIGVPEFVTADMVKKGVVIIDVGTTRVKSDQTKSGWKLKGDVKFDEVAEKAGLITPVPGGVGPMTIASLLYNTLLAYKKKQL
ncbi:MAG: bifunctional 5,10-methylene-tetrahydrofolate dehydrogenase/5,10-methylene-tetrahydrofolate cyclohydrolase [Bacteroidales bacterium]|nr:bifunctional 5,10-methylene-tetrahydrofolate dehydrogenase/5,10-methylene-tetrahydrofolate cyclohydrolase [Bacteroidales bacterium]